jgi:Rab family protein
MVDEIIELKEVNEPDDFSIKIVIVGDSGVGKSNILSRYIQNSFSHDSKATVGVELSTKIYMIKDKIVRVQIWDTAGQERYKSITAAYYKGAKGAMMVYDITRSNTFSNIDKWYNELIDYGDKDVVPIIIGNKSDLNQLRAIQTETALDKALSLGVPLIETSAYNSFNIDVAFKKLINGIIYLIKKSIYRVLNRRHRRL